MNEITLTKKTINDITLFRVGDDVINSEQTFALSHSLCVYVFIHTHPNIRFNDSVYIQQNVT